MVICFEAHFLILAGETLSKETQNVLLCRKNQNKNMDNLDVLIYFVQNAFAY